MLWDALKRAHLVGSPTSKRGSLDGAEPPSAEDASAGRFSLDTVIEEEGANLSVGQVGLLPSSLCAAAVFSDFALSLSVLSLAWHGP